MFRFFVPFAILLVLHSAGFWCDNCCLASSHAHEDSCSSHDKEEQHDHKPSDSSPPSHPCTNSLCGLCGHALHSSVAAMRFAPTRDLNPLVRVSPYKYLPVTGVFRPPQDNPSRFPFV